MGTDTGAIKNKFGNVNNAVTLMPRMQLVKNEILLKGLNSQIDKEGNIVNYINAKRLIGELQSLDTYDEVCVIKTISAPRRNPNEKKHTHMMPVYCAPLQLPQVHTHTTPASSTRFNQSQPDELL